MSDSIITISHLIDLDLLHPAAAHKHRGKHKRFNEILNGVGKPALESQVTTFMTMFTGSLEQAVVRFFCTAAGAAFTTELQIISGGEFRSDSTMSTRRTIDLVVVGRNDDKDPVAGGLHWHPVAAVEAKYGAWVNAGNGYCGFVGEEDRHQDGHLPYSNQVICYLHGCIDGRLSLDEKVKFIWLGEGKRAVEGLGPWGLKGLHPGDAARIPGYAEAYPKQQAAIESWTPVTWGELGEAITRAVGGPEAEAIVRFLRAGGPSAN
ncbi:hypothetical protein [Pseudarthrobacter sp. BIM B-2242]|uniref:hypothetical protein n=1 Tax=Pseudarthrobacter sp. BIM B-2242 TaxID=2772401 RepID=UPI00168B3695|nr:hypothetical protein [Pseudarthrobacter sp. BIM B-2242]QOD05874.1 hypothetical protein IDT60_23070 [Pseudarthrobacter sp. BIM B-2242]